MTADERALVRQAAERIHPVFVAQGWTWHERGVPTVDMIADSFAEKIEHLRTEYPNGGWSTSGGRLMVQACALAGWRLLLDAGHVPDCVVTNDCGNPDHQHYLDYLASLDTRDAAGTEALPSADATSNDAETIRRLTAQVTALRERHESLIASLRSVLAPVQALAEKAGPLPLKMERGGEVIRYDGKCGLRYHEGCIVADFGHATEHRPVNHARAALVVALVNALPALMTALASEASDGA